MPSSMNSPIKQNVEAALTEVAEMLHRAAADAEGLSLEASSALTQASTDVKHAAESLRRHASVAAKSVLQKAAHEAQEHPIASLAAAITAAAALVNVIASRHKDG